MKNLSAGSYEMRVDSIEEVAIEIKLITLKEINDNDVSECQGGSNIVLDLPMKDKLRKNTYSVIRRTADCKGYEIAVLKNENGRGGSKWIHEELAVETVLTVSTPSNMFPINITAQRNILFAGGIGITPMISYIEWFERYGGTWELHYASRGRANCYYYEELMAKYSDRVTMYFGEDGKHCNMQEVLMNRKTGTHAYICGPGRMIKAFHTIGESIGWPDIVMHSEAFAADGGAPFEVNLLKSKITVSVKSTDTLLDAIEDAGVKVPNICRGGGCGFCKVSVKAGIPEHRDFFLTDQEKEENDSIMVCVSRCIGDSMDLDI